VSRRIAIVEDDPAIRANYADVLRHQGYDVRLPDLAVVDIGLGEEVDGGFTLCRDLRGLSATLPIIFLTARDSEFDTVSGLRLGADDYLTKDASLPHLLARIAALFRRVDAQGAEALSEDVLERGPLRLDLHRITASWRDCRLDLTLTEFWIVHALARHPGHVRSREQLMGDARMVVDDSTVTSHVKRIRKKLLAVDPGFDRIESVYGMGYRWREE
jgi:two-component system OmpR family response regulator